MGTIKRTPQLLALLILLVHRVQSAVHELNQVDEKPTLYRQVRDDRYYQQNRYGGSSGIDRGIDRGVDRPFDRSIDRSAIDRDRIGGRRNSLKPVGDNIRPEARGVGDRTETDQPQPTPGVEKRCIRCATSYLDPYDYRDYHDRYYDRRYDDRRYEEPRYDERYYDRYDRSYYDRDRWYDRRPAANYDDRWYDYYRSYYDRYDRGSFDRGYDRGFGYDNRGYDNRQYRGGSDPRGGLGYPSGGGYEARGGGYGGYGGGYDARGGGYDYRGGVGYRPWDETARGASGWDGYGRGGGIGGGIGGGYQNRPDYWGYDRNYAQGYYYGGRGEASRDPYRRYDPYDGYRGTSYLYERQPTPVTTARPPPPKDSDVSGTERPGSDNKPDTEGSGSG